VQLCGRQRHETCVTFSWFPANLQTKPAIYTDPVAKLQLVQDPAADALLDSNPFALLVGMLLDHMNAMAAPRLVGGRAHGVLAAAFPLSAMTTTGVPESTIRPSGPRMVDGSASLIGTPQGRW
jgi:hypothetical protein